MEYLDKKKLVSEIENLIASEKAPGTFRFSVHDIVPGLREALYVIGNMPVEESTDKTAYWRRSKLIVYGIGQPTQEQDFFSCSNCNVGMAVDANSFLWNYCPNCGAKITFKSRNQDVDEEAE